MEFICAKCNIHLEKTSVLLRYGCPNCGSKVFTTSPTSGSIRKIQLETSSMVKDDFYISNYEIIPKVNTKADKRLKDLKEDHIPSIKLKEKGVYEVNIECLFRDKKSDPIILSGESGIYRVELPSLKKEIVED